MNLKLWAIAFSVVAVPAVAGCGADADGPVGTYSQKVTDSRPIWERTVKVAVNDSLVAQFSDGVTGATAWAQQILDEVTMRYSDPAFDGRIVFTMAELYVYPDDQATASATISHPNATVGLIFNSVGNGWYGGAECAQNAYITFTGSVGSQLTWDALGGIAHELGHAQGLGDIYRIGVLAGNNPFNGEPFDTPPSIMEAHWINPVQWDFFNVAIMNYLDGDIGSCRFSLDYFPPQSGVRVVDDTGAPVAGASVRFYPVQWTCDSASCNYVSTTPYLTGTTDSAGQYVWEYNPFIVDDPTYGRGFFTANTLVEVAMGGAVSYQYLPLWDPMMAFFDGQSEFMQEFSLTIPDLALSVEHRPGDGDGPDNNIVIPFLQVSNTGPDSVSLDELALEYYSNEPALDIASLQSELWYFYAGDRDYTNPIGDVAVSFSELSGSADVVASITFSGGHELAPGETLVLKWAYHASDWSYNFGETDDWSYTANNGTYNPAPNVVVRDVTSGNVIAGNPPTP